MTEPRPLASASLEHLSPGLEAMLVLPPEKRILEHWTRIFISYPRAQSYLKEMEELRDGSHGHRPHNMLLYSTTGNGKTALLREFLNLNPRRDDAGEEWAQIPVLYIQAPPKPDENRFWNAVLNALGLNYRPTEALGNKESLALKAMRGCGLKLLIIDEIHNVLVGHYNQQRLFLTVIKNLSNELQLPIVAAGIVDAVRAMVADGQLASRFDKRHLPDWKLDDDFLQLLVSFESVIPLAKPSNLADDQLAIQLHAMSGGIIGELSRLLKKAAYEAVSNGTEQITRKLLNSLDWQSPGERKRGV